MDEGACDALHGDGEGVRYEWKSTNLTSWGSVVDGESVGSAGCHACYSSNAGTDRGEEGADANVDRQW